MDWQQLNKREQVFINNEKTGICHRSMGVEPILSLNQSMIDVVDELSKRSV